jgi:copper oxidase (laccase) domain-containing protein
LGIAAKTVAKMVSHYGCAPEDVRAAFGPCIGACCFEVESSLRETLRRHRALGRRGLSWGLRGKLHLVLEELNFRQLVAAGLREEVVVRPGICTIENLTCSTPTARSGAPPVASPASSR